MANFKPGYFYPCVGYFFGAVRSRDMESLRSRGTIQSRDKAHALAGAQKSAQGSLFRSLNLDPTGRLDCRGKGRGLPVRPDYLL